MSVPLIVAGAVVQIVGFMLALTLSLRTRREQSPGEQSLASWTWAQVRRIGGQAGGWTWRKVRPVPVRLHLVGPRTVSTSVNIHAGVGLSGKLWRLQRKGLDASMTHSSTASNLGATRCRCSGGSGTTRRRSR